MLSAVDQCALEVIKLLFFFFRESMSACVNMVTQIQVQIGDTGRVFSTNPRGSVEDFEKTTFHVRFRRHVL